jgi:hypothetical protein
LIALGIVDVDGLPWGKEEHLPMVRILRQEPLQLVFGQSTKLTQHAKRVDDSTLEEDQARARRLLTILPDVLTKNGLGELQWRRSGTQ